MRDCAGKVMEIYKGSPKKRSDMLYAKYEE